MSLYKEAFEKGAQEGYKMFYAELEKVAFDMKKMKKTVEKGVKKGKKAGKKYYASAMKAGKTLYKKHPKSVKGGAAAAAGTAGLVGLNELRKAMKKK